MSEEVENQTETVKNTEETKKEEKKFSRDDIAKMVNAQVDKIKNDLESKGYYVPKNAVPMQEVVKYLNIDIDYLESRSKNLKGDVKIAQTY